MNWIDEPLWIRTGAVEALSCIPYPGLAFPKYKTLLQKQITRGQIR
jgi:hypothetical protein